MNITRRSALSTLTLGTIGMANPIQAIEKTKGPDGTFRFCLNTSTISGQLTGIQEYIAIASRAGYEGIEVWVRDVKEWLDAGHSAASLKQYIIDHRIRVESAIGFAPWMAEGEAGFSKMEQEMNMLAEIGCQRIAAPPAGVSAKKALDLFEAGEKYARLIELGRKTGVMPQLEFWGASPVLWHMGQVLMIAAVASDPHVRILPDVYHMFRGGSGFDTLKMLDGSMIEIFHMNDYSGSISREKQTDADRVYPGDGAAPLNQILGDLKQMGGEKVLSLELFNRSYWEKDPLEVAKTGLEKMKTLVGQIS